jgi:hypothetical protein
VNKLDEALVELRQDMDDAKKQSKFYDLFLNSTFLIPILKESEKQDLEIAAGTEREVLPLVVEAEGKDYLMIFDTLERLKDWTKDEEDVPCVEVAGHQLALTTAAPLHWAMNVGTEYSKQFFPEEIAWLKEVVDRCNAEASGKQEGCCGE